MIKGEDILCSFCLRELPKTHYDFNGDNPIKTRLTGRLPLAKATAFLKFRKTGITQKLLHQLKYNNHPEIGVKLGKVIAREVIEPSGAAFDLIVPVPLHSSRLRHRGYNQSAKLAEGISVVTTIPWNDMVSVRKQRTETQTKMNRVKRWENVQEVFASQQHDLIKGKHILLVDDVITTGATLEACGRHLVEAGAASLSIICIAEAQ